jgi:hypothetical protein
MQQLRASAGHTGVYATWQQCTNTPPLRRINMMDYPTLGLYAQMPLMVPKRWIINYPRLALMTICVGMQ